MNGKGGLSPAAEALKYGRTPATVRLHERLPKVTGAEARWRPLKGGGLELVDRQGRPSGWALVPLGPEPVRPDVEEHGGEEQQGQQGQQGEQPPGRMRSVHVGASLAQGIGSSDGEQHPDNEQHDRQRQEPGQGVAHAGGVKQSAGQGAGA
jgi:hypothetical protein